MKINIQFRRIIAFAFIFILGSQLSYGKFKFPPNDSLYEHHTLKGHKFIVNSVIGTPFIESYLQNRLGVAKSLNLEIPLITIDTQHVTELKGDLIYTTLDVEFQQAIKNWMAFRARVIITGKLGTEAGTLISQGLNLATGYEFGWLFKLYRNKQLAVSGSLDLSNTNFTLINLQEFIEGIIDSGRIVSTNNLVKSLPSLKFGGSLNGSYAFNKTIGFTGRINLAYGETLDRTAKDKVFFDYGGAFDADLMPDNNIPIGFLLGFYHNALPQATEEIVSEPNNILFGINYTGRQDLNLGLEGNYQFYRPVSFDTSIKLINLSMNFRYFF